MMKKVDNMRNTMDSIERYEVLTEEEKQTAQEWIANNLIPKKTFNPYCSSYGLKHYLERDTDLYLYNGAMKGAMLAAGYEPKSREDKNWIFKISEKSPGVKPRDGV